jgi:hypothetical protein
LVWPRSLLHTLVEVDVVVDVVVDVEVDVEVAVEEILLGVADILVKELLVEAVSSGEGVLRISNNFSLVLLWFSFGEVLVKVCSEI